MKRYNRALISVLMVFAFLAGLQALLYFVQGQRLTAGCGYLGLCVILCLVCRKLAKKK